MTIKIGFGLEDIETTLILKESELQVIKNSLENYVDKVDINDPDFVLAFHMNERLKGAPGFVKK